MPSNFSIDARVWKPLQIPFRVPPSSDAPKEAKGAELVVEGRQFLQKVPQEHVFFGATMEANRSTVELQLRHPANHSIPVSISSAGFTRFLCGASAPTACLLGLAIAYDWPISGASVLSAATLVGVLYLGLAYTRARTQSRDTVTTLRQLNEVYQAHEATGFDNAHALLVLKALEGDRVSQQLHAPTVRALDELHALLLADARSDVRELALGVYAERNRCELASSSH